MAIPLKDKTIIITGASSGIGAATARACAAAGMNVVLNARRAERLLELKNEIESVRGGAGAEVVAGDVTDTGISERMLDAAHARFGGFHAVFANAGYGMDKPMHELSAEDVRKMFEVNVFTGLELLSLAARRLIADGKPGHLLMCSSILARFAIPGHGLYCATKSAQWQMCRAMRMELRPHRIHVSTVHPITTVTEFFDVSSQLSKSTAKPDAGKPVKMPGVFVQPASKVANAVVKCLRRPRAEVWTTATLHLLSGIIGLVPATADRFIGRMM
ncbi:MAG TPA: SDR family NAD(P)-dependent oxidoreductase [Phycisphaerales bacterium]|nr:SDR family NAD(P)-dependent oxidoreductase [Phycisphaerales bacterium]